MSYYHSSVRKPYCVHVSITRAHIKCDPPEEYIKSKQAHVEIYRHTYYTVQQFSKRNQLFAHTELTLKHIE